ncbi:hypothetical protein NSND_63031 [Nitrospira sp. ND1]|nr:hypothetical protein NSND_63031 [Nitrospira sp. ND1]
MSRTNLTFPNGIQTTYTYDSVSQVTDILHQLPVTSTQIYKAGRPTTSIRSSREGGKDYPKNRPPNPYIPSATMLCSCFTGRFSYEY